MSAITFTALNYTGTPDTNDILAAQKIVREENARRAALTPPGTPLSTVGAALKTSVLSILTTRVTEWWGSYTAQARTDRARFTDAQLEQMLANLNARLDAGATADSLVTDTAS